MIRYRNAGATRTATAAAAICSGAAGAAGATCDNYIGADSGARDVKAEEAATTATATAVGRCRIAAAATVRRTSGTASGAAEIIAAGSAVSRRAATAAAAGTCPDALLDAPPAPGLAKSPPKPPFNP